MALDSSAYLIFAINARDYPGSLALAVRTVEVALLFQQNSEVRCPGGITAIVGAPERDDGAGQIIALREQAAEIEGAVGVATRVGAPVGGVSALLRA